jgi:hypothetical protein
MIIPFLLAIIHGWLRLGRSATLTTTAGLPATDVPTLVKHGCTGNTSRCDTTTRRGEYRGLDAGPHTPEASHKLSLSSGFRSISD